MKYICDFKRLLIIIIVTIMKDLDWVTTAPRWYSLEQPKPLYKNDKGKAYWDVPVFAENVDVRNNRIDARVINKEKKKKVYLLEMSEEKALKYAPLRFELRQHHPGYDIEPHNIVIDALGGCSANVRKSIRELPGEKTKVDKTLSRTQKAI